MADDAAVSTAWGRDWEKSGLLQKLRGESIGGEEFFSLLAEVSQKPQANADLLELMYVCLALGFEGRYRGKEGGQAQLDKVRADLHALVTRRRPPPAGGLSARWEGAKPGAVPKMAKPVRSVSAAPAVPWRFAAGAVAAGLVLFLGYRVFDKPAPVVVATEAAAPKVEPLAVEAPAVAPVLAPHKMLEEALAAELKGGLVALSEDSGRSVIVLRHPGQFSSGHVELSAEARAAIEALGAALERVPGPILVRGYSDGLPVHTAQFASNRELSAARAQAAATVLAAKLSDPRRMASEGAAEADPIAPNDTEPNRAKNRRVVIIVGPKP
jgi:type VI secretion system protein ImpK